MATPSELLHRLDARHDELICKLDELNAQIEEALMKLSKWREDKPTETSAVADDLRHAA